MNTAPTQHAAEIASSLAAVIDKRDAPHPARRHREHIAELLYTACTALLEAEQPAASGTTGAGPVPADAALPLREAEILASRAPGTGLPTGFTAIVLAPVTGRAPEPPSPVNLVSPHLAREEAKLRARLALVEEWLLDTQHPDVVPAYVALSLALRIKLALIADTIPVDEPLPYRQR
ncbi:hypothetical protein ACIREO_22225 [Streptomyces sp. NPDC102441]|uniref:hypothetical protein n=1 Tax=Streptomyces sp. NPDC102441 TaxID=3366176 RepID=UPI0037FAED74